MWLGFLICSFVFVSISGFLEDEAIFDMNRYQMSFKEQGRHHRLFESLRRLKHEGRVSYYTIDSKNHPDLLFKGSISCGDQIVEIIEIEAFVNGYSVGLISKMNNDYTVTEDLGIDPNHLRNIKLLIKHKGCVPADKYCYGVSEFHSFFNPRTFNRGEVTIDLLRLNYREECYGFFSRFIRMF